MTCWKEKFYTLKNKSLKNLEEFIADDFTLAFMLLFTNSFCIYSFTSINIQQFFFKGKVAWQFLYFYSCYGVLWTPEHQKMFAQLNFNLQLSFFINW